MRFKIYGHENVLATHPTTLEFTKDKELTLKGNCIVGVGADFKVNNKIINSKKIKITIECDGIIEEITSAVNPDFDDDKEIVVRLSEFNSKRTLGINADKASVHIDRRIIDKLKDPNNFANVVIEAID